MQAAAAGSSSQLASPAQPTDARHHCVFIHHRGIVVLLLLFLRCVSSCVGGRSVGARRQRRRREHSNVEAPPICLDATCFACVPPVPPVPAPRLASINAFNLKPTALHTLRSSLVLPPTSPTPDRQGTDGHTRPLRCRWGALPPLPLLLLLLLGLWAHTAAATPTRRSIGGGPPAGLSLLYRSQG